MERFSKRKLIGALMMLLAVILLAVFLSANLHLILTRQPATLSPIKVLQLLQSERIVLTMSAMFTLLGGVAIAAVLLTQFTSYKNKTQEIFPSVETPVAAGHGECGTSEWTPREKIKNYFDCVHIDETDKFIKWLVRNGFNDEIGKRISNDYKYIDGGGVVLGKDKNSETYYFNGEDTHTLILGATRSGKTRTVCLPTICVQSLSGESMICSDPKAEQYLYTYPFLERLGYKVWAVDFLNPNMSTHYNFLQNIIDYVNDDKIPKAIDATWDIVSALVGEAKGERIWNDGECAIIACGILAVVYDNKDSPEYQNMTNVYHFLGKMCKEIKGKLPLEDYLRSKPEWHPAKALVDISDVAPSRTRGSFFTSALSTLRLFTAPYIYDMTCKSDFRLNEIGKDRTAVFIILPDEKSTFYSVATLFCNLAYVQLVEEARKNGNRLNRRVNFNLDELGNFTELTDISKMLTVGGGYGLRLNMFLQDFEQLTKIYGAEVAKTLRSNCELWLYLKSANEETNQEFSKKLGTYTIKSPSISTQSGNGGVSVSSSYNYTSRDLLNSSELAKLKRPYQLATTGRIHCVMYSPDLSQTIFQRLLGLGDKEYNIALIKRRQDKREKREVEIEDMKLWGVWNKYYSNSAAHDGEGNMPPMMRKSASSAGGSMSAKKNNWRNENFNKKEMRTFK